MPGSMLGNSVRRVEDPDLLTGRSTFVDNHAPDGVLHAVFVRSPLAHGRIAAIDVGAAATVPGVVAVYRAEDLDLPATPPFAVVNPGCDRPVLARGTVRYVGDPVVLVVAESPAVATDAASLVDIDYEPLPVASDMEAALADDAPLQFPELGTNIAGGERDRDHSDPLSGADRVVRARIENPRLAVAPIEGNAVLVEPQPGGGLVVHLSTQMPHGARDDFAGFNGLDPGDVRVIAPHVGGAFGGKAGITPEEAVVSAVALRLDRPVKWTENRSEAMLSMHGRGQVQFAELGLREDGSIVGLRCRVIGDCGAYAGFGGGLAIGPTYLMSQGVYDIPELRYDAVAVLTNTTPVGAFRGAGRPEAAAMLERMMDLAADDLGIDPIDLRRRNLIATDRFPFTAHSGARYDVGDYDLPLREALRIADYDGLRREQQQRRDRGDVRQLGIGVGLYVEVTGGGAGEFGSVEIAQDGTATVSAGTSSHGQGHATSFSMLVAGGLGLPLESIAFVQSDTARVPRGAGTGGSRSLQLGGNAVRAATESVRDQARGLAARMLEAAVDDVVLADDGTFQVTGVPAVRLRWAEVAAYAHDQGEPMSAGLDFRQDGATFPFGAHVSVVEVDTETGRVVPLRHVAVDDCGRVLNPLLVAGQQHGGAVQGIAQALWEGFVYDEDGTPLTSTFADYSLPSAADAPSLEVHHTETPTPLNPLGAKGIGESASVGSTPAVHNAVVDAVSHLGVRHVDMPCTPDRVWAAIRAALRGELADPWRDPPAVFATLPDRAAPDPGAAAPETI